MMAKNICNILFTLLWSITLNAGGDPCSATFVDVQSGIDYTFDNIGASNSFVEDPPYGNYIGSDFWLSFVMDTDGTLPVLITPGSMINPSIALYSGDCYDPQLLYNIIDNNCDGSDYPSLLITELNPGETYFIRIWSEFGIGDGTFDISFDNSLIGGEFLTYGSAVELGDGCYQLTAEVNGQNGCAWYENTIDFNTPFTHTMQANFGDIDGNGADGICLIYQSNGTDICGFSGQGIGAGGMPNSVVVEFDTWQNPNLNDPVADHSAISLNGDLNHATSIAGPISLTNIEDGNFHDIEFSWDPGSFGYTVSFDGVQIMAGNYDFVNLVFGGQNLVWWGYTSATGGASNEHIICPEVIPPIPLGTQSYIPQVICEGESYLGYTETGFYLEYYASSDGCLHQDNIDLEVIPASDPGYFYMNACPGEAVYFNNQVYTSPGSYESNFITDDGCDSLVYLNIETFDFVIDIDLIGVLSCVNDSVELVSDIIIGSSYTSLNYNWTGQGINEQTNNLTITSTGEYILTVDVDFDGHSCTLVESIVVGIDTTLPILPLIEDVEIICGEELIPLEISINQEDNTIYSLYQNDMLLFDTLDYILSEEGVYILIGLDTISGCIHSDTFNIDLIGDFPSLQLSDTILNCVNEQIIADFSVSDDVIQYEWYTNGNILIDTSYLIIDEPGLYELRVTNIDGCTSVEQMLVSIDTIKPIFNYDSVTIECNLDSLIISNSHNDSSFDYFLLDNSVEVPITNSFVVNEEGTIEIIAINPENGCEDIELLHIVDLGDSPIIDLTPYDISCNLESYFIDVIVDQDNVVYEWSLNNNPWSSMSNPEITLGGAYHLLVSSETGCITEISFQVDEYFDPPNIEFMTVDTLTCDQTSVLLNNIASDNVVFEWNGPNGFISEEENPSVGESGVYYINLKDTINGCSIYDSIIVEAIGTIPNYALNSGYFDCSTDIVTINLESQENYEIVEWVGPNGYSSNSHNDIEILTSGYYYIYVENQYGCEKEDTIYVDDITLFPIVELLSDDKIIFRIGEEYSIETKISLDEENIVEIEWNPKINLSCYDCLNPTFLPTTDDTIVYTLTIRNAQGCTDQISLIMVEEVIPVEIIAPNVITPQDLLGGNNLFTLYGTPEKLIEEIDFLRVYDRWGGLMYEEYHFPINSKVNGWDGTFNNEFTQPGVFVFVGNVKLKSGEFIIVSGDVTVLR